MQSTRGEELTDVLIDLIGTEDNEDESRQENGSFSALNPGINSALVIAQSTARPDAFNRHSGSSSSEISSLRGRSGRLSYDRIREGFTRSPTLKSHSDASTLSWSRSINTQADDRSFGGHAHPQEPELIRLSPVSCYSLCFAGIHNFMLVLTASDLFFHLTNPDSACYGRLFKGGKPSESPC